jgi:RimJ/RimL family protein N-acetyltransferase
MKIGLDEIDIEEAARLGVGWLNAPYGVETLRLLGNIVPDDFKTNLATEISRLTKIFNDPNILAYSIKYNGKIVGILEIKLKQFEDLKPPSLTIFVGDINLRGKGIGNAAIKLALQELKNRQYKTVYARTLTKNIASQKMLQKTGFKPAGQPYTDKDNLTWQNYKIAIN